MRKTIATVSIGLALLGSANAVAAQDDPFERAARETNLDAYGPVAVLFVTGALGPPADSFSFYLYWDPPSPATAPDRRRRYAVRKASRTEARVQWASSRDCPGLIDVLTRLEAVPTPRIDVPGVGDEAFPNLMLDGVTYDLSVRWALWTDNAAAYMLRMSGNVNTPLAAWGRSIDPALEACWSSDAPLEVRPPSEARPKVR